MEGEQQGIEQLRQMADRLDCFILEDFLALSQYTETTAKALRKRGEGPPYTLLGKRVLYPKQGVAEFLASRVRTPRPQFQRGTL